MNNLFKRDFTLVVIGQVISLFGNAILRFALPLYLLRETASSSLFGAVTACSFIPMIIFSLLGGVIADRKNKRNIMVVLDFTTAAVIALFYIALGKIPLVPLMISALMILYGISGAYQPAVQASIPLLTDKETLMKGNAVINMVSTLSGLLGPIIGGVLFGSFGILPILFIGIGCFVFSAVMEIFIHIPYEKSADDKSVFKAAGSDLRECFSFVKNEKPIFLSVLGILALFNLSLSAAMVVGIPVTVVQALGMSDTALGLTEAAMGLGGLAGGIIAGAAAQKMRLKNGYITLVICSLMALLMGIALLDAVPPIIGYIIITAASFGTMCTSTMFTVTLFTAVQQQTPPLLLGKIMAVIIAVSSCSQPLGQAVYGVLFDVLSELPYAVMIGAAAVSLAVALCSKKIFARLESSSQE
ncbi:MAG: MFS transporter [Oscillospiraceae bacterium]|nr:MFS transporter [Oscillospiraceae bacterium]